MTDQFQQAASDYRNAKAASNLADLPAAIWRTLESHQRQIDAARQTIASQANVIAGMAAKIESLTESLEAHSRAIGQLQEREFNRMERESKARVTQVCDPIITADIGKRLDALERQMPAALGLTPVERPATPVEQAINQVNSEVDALRKNINILSARVDLRTTPYPGLPTHQKIAPIDSSRWTGRAGLHDGSHSMSYTKPTIKGGWVNVYRDISAWHPTRQDADDAASSQRGHRLACLHIPDFTEGDGLNPHEK